MELTQRRVGVRVRAPAIGIWRPVRPNTRRESTDDGQKN